MKLFFSFFIESIYLFFQPKMIETSEINIVASVALKYSHSYPGLPFESLVG